MQNMQGKTALGLDANIGALLCYLANIIPCIVPLGLVYSIIVIVQDKTNKLARFHAFQSLLLSAAALVISIPLSIIFIIGFFLIDAQMGVPIITMLMTLVFIIFGLAMFVLVLLAAIKAFQGQIYKIPIIGNLADKYSN
ncbi:MAG TPA: hypothetical protein VGB02_04800 [Pyrinomonadaceae bacterium]|jgi:uncharacterized membrane protein